MMRAAILALAGLAFAGRLGAQTPVVSRSLSLGQALELAEKQSEAVGIARAELARAQGDQRRARSAYYPQLNGSASYQRTLRSQFSALQSATDTATTPGRTCNEFLPIPSNPVEQRLDSLESAVQCFSSSDPFAAFKNLPFGRENAYRVGLSFSQTIYSGGQVRGQSQAAAAEVRSAALGLTAAQAQLLLDVTGAYFDAALADRLVSIAEATLQQADTTLSQTRLARQVGNQSEFELLRARVTRDNQRPVVIQRRADRELAQYRLKQLLDFPLEQPLVLTTELGDTALANPSRIKAVVAQLGDTAEEARAPVRQASEAVQAQRGLLRAARGERLPQLALTSQYALLGYPNNVSPFTANFISDWTVSVGLQIPLLTGGRIGGEVAAAEANLSQAQLRLQQSRELAQLDARNAETQLDAAAAGWEASAGTVEQAAQAYQIAEVRFREGISTQTELLDSRIQLEQAQASRARAARDLQVAKVRVALLPALPLASTTGGTAAVIQTVLPGGAPVQPTTPSVPTYQSPAAVSTDITGLLQPGASGQ